MINQNSRDYLRWVSVMMFMLGSSCSAVLNENARQDSPSRDSFHTNHSPVNARSAPAIVPEPTSVTMGLGDTTLSEANTVIVNNQGYGQGSYDLDEIRVGCTWQDVIGVFEANEHQ